MTFDFSRIGLAVALLFCAGAGAVAEESDQQPQEKTEQLLLKSGGRLSGTSLGLEDGSMRWEFADGAQVLVPLASIERLELPAWEEDPHGAIDAERMKLSPDPISRENDGYWKSVYGACERVVTTVVHSTKRIEVGARLLDGNTDTDYVDVAGRFEHVADNWVRQLEFQGQYAQQEGDPNTNRWTADLNIDYDNGKDERWILFATNKNEYDEFENLDYRGTYSAGVGYRFFNEPRKRLIFRVGPAATVEFFHDPSDTRITPDAFGEVETIWPLNDWLHYEAKSNIRPSLEDLEVFRAISNHGLLVQLDEEGRWSLKLGLRYEYNSKPVGTKVRSDYTTSILLIYSRKD